MLRWFCILATLQGAATSLHAAGQPEKEGIAAHFFVPSDSRRHGEVRLVVGPGQVAVETLLFSPSLRRGIQAIGKKEAESWPEGREGHADSQATLGALERGSRIVLAPTESTAPVDPKAPVPAHRPIPKMLIRLQVNAAGAAYTVSHATFPIPAGDGPIDLESETQIESVPVSDAYARANMQHMLEAVGALDDADVRALLAHAFSEAHLTKD